MTTLLALFLVVLFSYLIYLLWHWLPQSLALPPYQNRCNQDCNQGRNCVCDTQELNPQATWPFPHSKP